MSAAPIYLATVLLEKNRWSSRQPSIKVSDWIPRIQQAGLDGLELWENHYLLASPDEQAALRASPVPIIVWNSYVDFTNQPEAAEKRQRIAQLGHQLQFQKIKYNLGAATQELAIYRQNLLKWADSLPADCQLLCECHRGTVLESPAEALKFFADLPQDRFKIIVHAFCDDQWEQWLRLLGPRLAHIHVSLVDHQDQRRCLSTNSTFVQQQLRHLQNHHFQGSYSLEFTEGVGTSTETPEGLFQNALNDLAVLRQHIKKA